MNTIYGIDDFRRKLERQHGNMPKRTAILICEKYEQRITNRLHDVAEKAEFANGSYRSGSIAVANVEHKPTGDIKRR